MKLLIALLIFSFNTAQVLTYDLPVGWGKKGSQPESYDMGVDVGAGQNKSNAATIKSIEDVTDGFGTLMQQISPAKYLGHRLKVSGFIKTKDVKTSASFWVRVDGPVYNQSLGFDNMANRPVTGTKDWTPFAIVLDVPNNATLLAYGGMLSETGQMWFDNLKFEIVDESVPTTDMHKNMFPSQGNEPINLDFEQVQKN